MLLIRAFVLFSGPHAHAAVLVDSLLCACRPRWLEVLHWVFWINSWHENIGGLLYGDKDTFSLGFALAGHAEHYRQVGGAATAL